jgi:hypothetical protein
VGLRKFGRWLSGSAILGLLVACSSSGGSYTATNCPGEGVNSGGCVTCIQANCATEISSLTADCSAADLACACPSGADPETCLLSPACETSAPDYESCIRDNCADDCSNGEGS